VGGCSCPGDAPVPSNAAAPGSAAGGADSQKRKDPLLAVPIRRRERNRFPNTNASNTSDGMQTTLSSVVVETGSAAASSRSWGNDIPSTTANTAGSAHDNQTDGQVVWLALKGMETAIIHQVRNRNKTVLIPRPPIVSMLVTALMLGMETNDLARNFHHRRAGAVVWAEDAAVRKRCPHG
jgi:hypothetical protein